MTFIVARRKSFQASAAIAKKLRVINDSNGQIAAAGITDNDIGTVDQAVLAANDYGDVNLRSLQGTEQVVAAGAITCGALVYTAASGKVSATAAATSYLRGRALETATADGDIIEILPMFARTAET